MAVGEAVRVSLFGTLELGVGDRTFGPRDFGGRKPKQVVEVLLTHRGEAVAKDRLIELIWGERLPRDPVRTLEAAVSVARSHLGESAVDPRRLLVSEPGAYRFPLDAAAVDLWHFDDLVTRAAREGGSAGRELRQGALALVRGDVLADEPYADWALSLRDLYGERHLQLLLACADDALTDGDADRALTHLEAVLQRQPARERAHRLLMAAHYVLGDQAVALNDYDRCRKVLVDELGVSPLPETERVYLAVLNQEAADEVVRVARQAPAPDPPAVPIPAPLPRTRFARCGSDTIAYQVLGEGPVDVVVSLGWFSHVEVGWEEPRFASFLGRLAAGRRILLFDRRGTGMSDPVPAGADLDDRADEIAAVMDAAGSERAVVFGVSEGGPMGISLAARRPDRVAGLLLYSCFGRLMATADYPFGWSDEFLELYRAGIAAAWTAGHGIEIALPTVTGDEALREWVTRYLRLSVNAAGAQAVLDQAAQTDVRHHLAAVTCPTLVLHRRDELWVSPENGRFVADRIPGARFEELPGVDYWPWLGEAEPVLTACEAFFDDLAGGAS